MRSGRHQSLTRPQALALWPPVLRPWARNSAYHLLQPALSTDPNREPRKPPRNLQPRLEIESVVDAAVQPRDRRLLSGGSQPAALRGEQCTKHVRARPGDACVVRGIRGMVR